MLGDLELAPVYRWGQNFLIDKTTFDRMADLVMEDRSQAQVLEIGPGVGGLTLSLLERGADVVGLEIDSRFKRVLDTLADRYPGHLTVLYQDALAGSWQDILEHVGFDAASIAGNLPYYATAPLMGRLLDLDYPWRRGVFMVQKEVAERLIAGPGHRNASVLSVLLRYRMDVVGGIGCVPAPRFWPAPEVSSAVIQLVRRKELPVDWEVFRWVVRAGFAHRRKMLRQALAKAPGSFLSKKAWSSLLNALGIGDSARAEELTLEQWVRMSGALMDNRKGGAAYHDF